MKRLSFREPPRKGKQVKTRLAVKLPGILRKRTEQEPAWEEVMLQAQRIRCPTDSSRKQDAVQ